MPNWAYTECTIVGDERDLQSLHKTIKEIEYSPKSRIENDFGKQWLGNLVDALGGDWQQIKCRGYWTDARYSEGQLNLYIESAWTPPTEVFDFIKKKSPDLIVLYFCEEPGACVYVTNDKEGLFYSARYLAKVCIDVDEYKEEYFDEEKDAFEWISNFVNKEIHTHKELQAFDDELQTQNPEFCCFLEEVKVV